MIGIPMTANSVYVSMVQTGCCKAEFDSTYPIHLNGIISQGEFLESISKINRTIIVGGVRRIATIIYLLIMLAAMACFIFGAIDISSTRYYGFPPLMSAGMALTFVGSLVFIILVAVMQVRQTTKLREAVAEESMKYSARSPTPCSWRLEVMRFWGGYGSNNRQVTYNLIIDIGRATTETSGNVYSNPGAFNQYAPPSYSSTSTTFCSKCGAARSDLSAQFCPSCGQAFAKQ